MLGHSSLNGAILLNGNRGLRKHPFEAQRQARRRGGSMTLPLDIKREFLDRVALDGNVSRVCRELGLNRSTVYEWRGDPDFSLRWDAALDMSVDGLREQVLETARLMGLGR